IAVALEEAWRRGARLDGWRECFRPQLWWQTFADLGIDTAWYAQRTRPLSELLPWDHVNVTKGREYPEKEQTRSLLQLQVIGRAGGGARAGMPAPGRTAPSYPGHPAIRSRGILRGRPFWSWR